MYVSVEKITELLITLTGNILLSNMEDINTAIEDTDSLQDGLINYWIINEQVYVCSGGGCVYTCVLREFSITIDLFLFNSSSNCSEHNSTPQCAKIHHIVLFCFYIVTL